MRSRLGAARRYTRRARREAAVNRSRHASLAGETLKTLQLARRLGGRAPRDDDPLAPRRLKTVLAPEVPTWPTADSSTITGSDPPHGEREPFVGEKRIANKLEHRSRRLIHCNVTTHPSAAWTLQQLRETTGFQRRYDYLLHDRDSIFAQHFGESGEKLEIRVLKSPPRRPMANAICECLIGTIRRECLDWLIPLSASHLRSFLKAWIGRYSSEYPASR